MSSLYDASSIEVLTGLEPVRKRPGMYTDTSRPNHLLQEIVDNSVDEVLAGHAQRIDVILYEDGSMGVSDDGRGMPVDLHPEEGLPGVEVILSRLHAGGKFSQRNYQFSGGLHGVGVSVVNALSLRLEVAIRRQGQIYSMAFANGDKVEDLRVTGKVGRQNTGTAVRFWPDPQFFDSPKFSLSHLRHLLRAKAVLAPGLHITFTDQQSDTLDEWHFEHGICDYLMAVVADHERLPELPFNGCMSGTSEAVDWAVIWLPEGGELLTESYVNLVPTVQGGTHVNGLRSGLTEAIREFCEIRSLLPRGVRIAPEDVWDRCAYVLSVKMQEPQFSGQTKERLSSRSCAAFVTGVVKDSFSLWLNQQIEEAEAIVLMVVGRAQARLRAGKKVVRKKVTSGPALPGKLADCSLQDPEQCELFLVEGDSAGGSAKQARDRQFQAIMPLRGKILNTWEVDAMDALASQEVHDISVAIGVDLGSDHLDRLRYGKICILADADSDGAHIATLLCALFVRHFPALVAEGHIYVAMPPLYRIDVGSKVYYALDDDERQGVLDRIVAEGRKGRVNVQRFKGLGEMNPMQLRETTIAPDSRRLVQLTREPDDDTHAIMDMLLAKKRSADRRAWLERNGDLARV